MGICIHYQGALRSGASPEAALALVRSAAAARGWAVREVAAHEASYTRTLAYADPDSDDEDEDDNVEERTGTLRGVVVEPHPMCEPFHVVLADDGLFEDFVKTGFAPAEVHLSLVELMHALEPAITWTHVDDEGEAWPGGDAEALAANRAWFDQAIAPYRDAAGVQVGLRHESGRIMDLVRDPEEEAEGDDGHDLPAPSFDADTGVFGGWGWAVDASGWRDVTDPENILTLQAEHDIVLQASNWAMDEAALDDEAVLGFAHQVGNFLIAPEPLVVGPFHGVRFRSNLGTHHFVGWTFRHRGVLLLISGTFPADLADADEAIASVARVVSTLHALPMDTD